MAGSSRELMKKLPRKCPISAVDLADYVEAAGHVGWPGLAEASLIF